jgi:hypothetical protein
MAKIKKMADGGMTSLGSLAAGAMPEYKDLPNRPRNPFSGSLGGGGGGGSASDGLGQINQGAGTVAGAISRASDALGGGGGGLNGAIGTSPNNDSTTYKKGGSAKKNSSSNSASSKISKVSTHEKNPKHKNCW